MALKILKNKKRLYKQGLVESKLIETLNVNDKEDKKNIVRRLDHFVFRKHLILTFELLSVNLYDFIKRAGAKDYMGQFGSDGYLYDFAKRAENGEKEE